MSSRLVGADSVERKQRETRLTSPVWMRMCSSSLAFLVKDLVHSVGEKVQTNLRFEEEEAEGEKEEEGGGREE